MKVFIERGVDYRCVNVNSFIAMDGFRHMGWEIVDYLHGQDIIGNDPEDIVVGGISDIKRALQRLGIAMPAPLDYPDELSVFLGREIWPSTMHTIVNQVEKWPVFVKPAKSLKHFTGLLIKEERDLIGCYDQNEDIEIWCSKPVNFLCEWRCFVRYGEVLDVRKYKSDWRLSPDAAVIEKTLSSFQSAPKAFALDFGLTDKGETLLVEVNDAFALGAYGLTPVMYAKLLSARWAELTNTRDYCNF